MALRRRYARRSTPAFAGAFWRRTPRSGPAGNPAPKRAEIEPFTSDELLWLAAELGPWGSVVQFAAATGLRPAEWIALERRDVRRDERVVIVERSFSRGVLRPYGKTTRSRRRVPLSRAALDALALQPLRIDTQLVFPAREGGHLDLHNWRSREWIPAVDAAGLRRGRRVYDLRHTFATNALAAGISLYELARFMGTSVRMIDQTYGLTLHAWDSPQRPQPHKPHASPRRRQRRPPIRRLRAAVTGAARHAVHRTRDATRTELRGVRRSRPPRTTAAIMPGDSHARRLSAAALLRDEPGARAQRTDARRSSGTATSSARAWAS